MPVFSTSFDFASLLSALNGAGRDKFLASAAKFATRAESGKSASITIGGQKFTVAKGAFSSSTPVRFKIGSTNFDPQATDANINTLTSAISGGSGTTGGASPTPAPTPAPAASITATLSAGLDTPAGGSGDDVFVATVNAHLQNFDSVSGNGGTDTLIIAENGTYAVTDDQFTSVTSVETLRLTGVETGAITAALGAAAAAAGVRTVNIQASAKDLDITGFTGALTVNGTSGSTAATANDVVTLSLANAGNKTLNLGAGADVVSVTPVADAAAGSVVVSFTSGSVGNGTNDNVTIDGPNGDITVNDEGTLIGNNTNATAIFNVVGLNAAGALDQTQNRGNFTIVQLGTSAADTATTTAAGGGAVYINGGGGNDILTSDSTGNHFLVGGAGDDTLTVTVAATGNNSVIGGDGADVVTLANNGNNVVTAGAGDDRVTVGGTGVNSVNLGEGTNAVTFLSGLQGTLASIADSVTGGTGIDTLRATSAQLTEYAAPSTRTISAIDVLAVTDALDGTLTTANLQAGINTVTLEAGTTGGAAVDAIAFEAGAKTVNVGAATNAGLGTVAGGTLGATLDISAAGSATTDALTLNNTNADAAGNAFGGRDVNAIGFETLTVNSGATATTQQSFRDITLRGSDSSTDGGAAADNNDALRLVLTGANAVRIDDIFANTDGLITIDASGLTAQAIGSTFQVDVIFGEDATDEGRVAGGTTAVGSVLFTGSAGEDAVNGSIGNDTLNGLVGDDFLFGEDGNDVINGGVGNDVLGGDNGNDTVSGDVGNDVLSGGFGNDVITGGAGNDRLSGGFGSNALDGGEGDDIFAIGEDGANTVVGAAGNDLVDIFAFGEDITQSQVIDLGVGDDVVTIGVGAIIGPLPTISGAMTILGGDGNDVVNNNDTPVTGRLNVDAGAGNDNVGGGVGNDIIVGGAGNDVLRGNAGNDVIDGGAGNDVINGGEGADSITLDVGVDTVTFNNVAFAFNADTVNGFTAGATAGASDVLQLGSGINDTSGLFNLIAQGANGAAALGAEQVLLPLGGLVIQNVGSDGVSLGANVSAVRLTGATYANDAAALADLSGAGNRTITLDYSDFEAAMASDESDAIFVLYQITGGGTAVAVLNLGSDNDGVAEQFDNSAIQANATLTTVVTLAGVATGDLVAANLTFVV